MLTRYNNYAGNNCTNPYNKFENMLAVLRYNDFHR